MPKFEPRFEMESIHGVIAALLTPFDRDEAVDLKRTENLIDFLIEKDIDGFYLTGSTGEGFLMDADERSLFVKAAIDRVAGRKPVIVHIGDIGTKKSIVLAKQAYKAGADAVSSVPPFYWKFSEGDIYNYYKDISDSTPLPMIIYNIQLAGLMSMSLIERLAKLENVRGLKFTGKDHDQMSHLRDILPKDFIIYSGCDEMAFSGLSVGTNGIIGSFYNVMPELFKKIYAAVQSGELRDGMRFQKIATEIILECIKYDYISLMRNMLKWQGVDAGYSRRPFTSYSDEDLGEFRNKLLDIKKKYNTDGVNLLNCL